MLPGMEGSPGASLLQCNGNSVRKNFLYKYLIILETLGPKDKESCFGVLVIICVNTILTAIK